VDVAVTVVRQDQALNEGSYPVLASARIPKGKTQILLAIKT
jgi:hypothetical protein